MSGFEEPESSGGSIAAPLIRALLAAAVVFVAYWVIFGGEDDLATPVAVEATTEPLVVATTETTPPPTFAPTEDLVPTTPPTTEAADPAAAQIGAGLSIQVLTRTDAERTQAAIQALTSYGYDVIDSGQASTPRDITTLFATAGHEADAEALVAADPRFTRFEPDNPGLSTEIDLHVVIADDWPAGTAADG